jgi:hypothetical protein
MAAGEDQAQAVIGHSALLFGLSPLVSGQQQGLSSPSIMGRGSTEPIDGPATRRDDDPARRTRWQTIGRPTQRGHLERVLDRFFGQIDVAEGSDQYGHNPPMLFPEHRIDLAARREGHAESS